MTHNDLFRLKRLSTDIWATKTELRNAIDELLFEFEKLQKEKEENTMNEIEILKAKLEDMEAERNEKQRLLKNELAHAVLMARENEHLMVDISVLSQRLTSASGKCDV